MTSLCNSVVNQISPAQTLKSFLLALTSAQSSGVGALYYLYHDVNILAILQQTQIGIEVKPVVLGVGAGVCQDHLALPQGLEEDFLPLCPLIRQQLSLKGQHNWRSSVS